MSLISMRVLNESNTVLWIGLNSFKIWSRSGWHSSET
jgi:hypothetical protein